MDRYRMMGGEAATVKAVRDPAGEWVRVEDLEWQIGQIQADALAFASCNRARKAAEAEVDRLREAYREESVKAHDAEVQRDCLLKQRERVRAVLDKAEQEPLVTTGSVPAEEQQLGRFQLLDEVRAALQVDAEPEEEPCAR